MSVILTTGSGVAHQQKLSGTLKSLPPKNAISFAAPK
jgi:hypothetical protein